MSSGEALTISNPHAVAVTGQIRLIPDAGAPAPLPVPFSIPAQGSQAFPTMMSRFGSITSPAIVAVESTNVLRISGASLRVGYPDRPLMLPVRFNPGTPASGSLLLGSLNGLVRVNIYVRSSSAPILSRTFGGPGEHVTRLRYVDLFPAGMSIGDGYAEVIPVTNQVVATTLNPPTRRRAVGPSPTVPLVLSITGGPACELVAGVRANAPAISGARYQWTIRNASAATLTESSVDILPLSAGVMTAELTMTIGGVQSFATVNVVVRDKPSIQSLTATEAPLGQQAAIRWNAIGAESARLYGTDFPSAGQIVDVASGEYLYSAPSVGFKSVELVAENSCGSSSATTAYQITPACTTPSAHITAPSSVAPNTSFAASMPGGASNYTWDVSGGTITSGQGTATVMITAGTSGVVAITGAASNGSGCEDISALNVLIIIPPPLIADLTAPSTLDWATTGSVSFTLENTDSWSITTSSTSKGWNGAFDPGDENYFGDPSQGSGGAVSWTGAINCSPNSNCTPKVSGSITLTFTPYLPNNDVIIVTAAGPGGTATASRPIKIPGANCKAVDIAGVVPVGGSTTLKVKWITSDAGSLAPSSSLGNAFTPANQPVPEGLGTYSFLYTRSVAGDDHVRFTGPGCEVQAIIK